MRQLFACGINPVGSLVCALILGIGTSCWVGAAERKHPPGMISNEEYKEGMEQRKLSIDDPDRALREKLWKPCASIAVGDGYSITLQFRQAHPMVAEYHRRVLVFSGSERRGVFNGALQLRMNFGGRTYIMIYRHLNADGRVTHLSFSARDEAPAALGQSIRLNDPDFEAPPREATREYVGLVSGEAYPLKFVSPLILSETLARQKMRE